MKAARVHRGSRRRGGAAVRCARAAGDAGGRISSSRRSQTRADLVAAFREGLKETGFVEGRNVAIEFRWAEYQFDRLPALAAELVAPAGGCDRRQYVVRRSRPRPRPRPSRSSSPPAAIRSGMVWSPASTGRAATSPAWSSSRGCWRQAPRVAAPARAEGDEDRLAGQPE